MNIIKPSHKIIRCTEGGIDAIAEAARTCYLSEPQDSPELREQFIDEVVGRDAQGKQASAWHISEFELWIRDRFITKLRRMGHQTPFEFMDIEIEFICDRGVSHEAVRHRMCSPMQESTRCCDYNTEGKHGLNVIDPIFLDPHDDEEMVDLPSLAGFRVLLEDSMGQKRSTVELNKFDIWFMTMQFSEWAYNTMLDQNATPQEARSVLPNSLKTKLKMKANVREWWHIFKLRAINSGAHPQIREIMIPALKECADKWPVLFDWLDDQLISSDPMDGQAKPKM